MSEHLPYPESEHKARLLLGDPVAQAWEWIVQYAASISGDPDHDGEEDFDYYYGSGGPIITADDLINTAVERIEGDDWAYLSRGGLLEGVGLDPTFWDKLVILKGIDIPNERRENFFSCSC